MATRFENVEKPVRFRLPFKSTSEKNVESPDASKLEPVIIPVALNELAVTIPVKLPCPVESIPTP